MKIASVLVGLGGLVGGCISPEPMAPAPDPASACTVQEIPMEVTLSRRLVALDYQAVPAHVFFTLWKVDGLPVRSHLVVGSFGAGIAASAGGATSMIGSGTIYPPGVANPTALPRYVPPPPGVEPVTIAAGRRILTLQCSGQLTPRSKGSGQVALAGARDRSAAERGDTMSYRAAFECEVELQPGAEYLVHTEMAGWEIPDGFYVTITDRSTGAQTFRSNLIELDPKAFFVGISSGGP